MSRQSDLAQHITDTYTLILEHEHILQTSSRPGERLDSRRKLDELRALAQGYLDDYRAIAGAFPADLAAIATHIDAPPPEPPDLDDLIRPPGNFRPQNWVLPKIEQSHYCSGENDKKMEFCNDFIEQVIPAAPYDEIPRDTFVRQIGQSFGSEIQKQMLIGDLKSGKTNLMAQFVRQHKNQCVAYFITPDPSTQLPYKFLYTLCCQASLLLGQNIPESGITLEELKTLLSSLSIKLARESSRRDCVYYFVIDGIENCLEGAVEERIIDQLPLLTIAPHSPYLLLSCRSDQAGKLPKHLNIPSISPLDFSRLEVETYLKGAGFSQQEVNRICAKYRTMPGYLKILKERKRITPNFDWESAPSELDQLIDEQVRLVMQDSTQLVITILETLAASPSSLPMELLVELVNQSEFSLTKELERVSIVKWNSQKRLEYVDDIVRSCVRKQVGDRIKTIAQRLQKHIQEKYPKENLLLTLLFKEIQDYEGLQNALTHQQIMGSIDTSRDMFGIMQSKVDPNVKTTGSPK